jgi:tetratricopeptide (TPR) repeat protein
MPLRHGRAVLFAALLMAAWTSGTPAQTEVKSGNAARPPTGVPAAEKDSVSVDLAAGYARILFSFKQPTQVNAAIADGVLTIRLNRAIGVSADVLTDKLGAYAGTGRRDANGLTYRFGLGSPVTLHNTARGNLAAVDLVPEGYRGAAPPDFMPPPPPKKEPPPDPDHLPGVKVRVGEYQNYTRLVFDWPTQIRYAAAPAPGHVTLTFQSAAKPDFSMLQRQTPAWVKNASWHLDGFATVVGFETDPDSRIHDFRDGNKIIVDVLAPNTDAAHYMGGDLSTPAPLPQKKKDAAPPKGADGVAAALPQAASPVGGSIALQPAPATAQMPSAELTRDGATLHFPAARGKAVAVFTRGETLWIVLDGHSALDAPTLLAPLATLIAKAEADDQAGAAILKLVLKTPLLASVSEDETALNVALSASAATPPAGIAFTRAGADGKIALTANLPGAARGIALSDADAGDHIIVVPGRQGRGVLTPGRFLEMTALASAAGIAIIPYADDLAAAVRADMVTFSRPEGLALSSASGAAPEPVVQVPFSRQGAAFVDFAQWGRTQDGDVYAAMRALRAAAAKLPESNANKARLQLARYLLAHDLAPEALGEIRLIQDADQKLANDPALEAMKGVAQTMMARYADARVTLSAGPLANNPHAALWRGIAETRLGDFADARRDLAVSQSVLRFYPASWQTRARLSRAETGLVQGDLASANDALDQLSPDLSPRDSVEARFFAAELLAAQGHVNEALARLTVLEKTDDAPIAARAAYARVDIALSAGKIKHAAAIEALERLRFRWRGDELELKTLRRLGGLYFADARWREGLETLRVAALNFPNSDLAREAQDDMRKAFTGLFLGGKADKMKPVDALALFYDFIELTPIGRDGDEMIRRLSDRLVAVDLLAPAEVLLDHQVSQRLDGVARAAVATKLATIYLLDHKPQDALRVINASRETRLPDDMNNQRRLLEARALAGVKQYDAAIDLVADDDSPQAKRLRADIYWESGNWKSAGDKAEDFLGDRWNGDGNLTDAERAEVMRAAVAFSLGGDEDGLERLRMRYGTKMNASPDAKAFGVVTEKISSQGVAFRDLAKTIASVDTLQAFMADFEKQGAAAPAKTASN